MATTNSFQIIEHWQKAPTPLKIIPKLQSTLWGQPPAQSNILKFLNRSMQGQTSMQPIAEMWFGAHKKSPADVQWHDQIVSLNDFIDQTGHMVLGSSYQNLPILLKMLDAKEPLSWQLHERIGPHAKNETWIFPIPGYNQDEKEDQVVLAELYIGFRPAVSMDPVLLPGLIGQLHQQTSQQELYRKEYMKILQELAGKEQHEKIHAFSNHIKLIKHGKKMVLTINGAEQAPDVMQALGLHNGFLTVNIPGATVHSLVVGTAFEIQQMSDKTLRLYDYGRDPQKRPLHIDEAATVLDFTPRAGLDYIVKPVSLQPAMCNLVKTKSYSMDCVQLTAGEQPATEQVTISLNNQYQLIMVTAGSGELLYPGAGDQPVKLSIHQGDLFLMPAVIDHYQLRTGHQLSVLKAQDSSLMDQTPEHLLQARQHEFWNQ